MGIPKRDHRDGDEDLAIYPVRYTARVGIQAMASELKSRSCTQWASEETEASRYIARRRRRSSVGGLHLSIAPNHVVDEVCQDEIAPRRRSTEPTQECRPFFIGTTQSSRPCPAHANKTESETGKKKKERNGRRAADTRDHEVPQPHSLRKTRARREDEPRISDELEARTLAKERRQKMKKKHSQLQIVAVFAACASKPCGLDGGLERQGWLWLRWYPASSLSKRPNKNPENK
ncbi:hypothetical protein C8R45DRAFT_1073390 [Mycena sanguinolenta]|nr:hypothetical protein C8R45DRAFT_1073390 [Mycena sanguinolenta]